VAPVTPAGAAVAVLEPAPLLMVAVQTAAGGRTEVQFHAGGQGVWVARMAAEMGGTPVLCAPFGGRSGALARALVEMDGVAVEAVSSHRSTAVWVSTGSDGEPADVAETPPPPLDRHEVDRLVNAMLAAGLDAGVAVLTGLSHGALMPAGVYGRLAADLTANGVTVVADVSVGVLERVLEGGVTLLKISQEQLVGAGLARDGSRAAAASAIRGLRGAGAGAVLVSRAGEPALADLGGRLVEIAPPRFAAVNPRGAGDAMTGTLAAALARGLGLDDALRHSVAAGALNVARRGLGSGDRRAVERLARTIVLTPLDDGTVAP
jgi:1-phosphofructokinase